MYIYRMPGHRSYCFTINNDRFSDLSKMLDMRFKYLVFGFETGKEGTPHIQGYVQFYQPRTFKTVKHYLPRAHIEVAHGDSYQNTAYCIKDGECYRFGEEPSSGGKLTFAQIQEAFADPENHPTRVMQYSKAYDKIKQLLIQKKEVDTEYYVINPIHDAITEIYEYFGIEDMKLSVITELSELSIYDDPENVVFFTDHVDRKCNLWPRGMPIAYKKGYEQCVIKPKRFIVVTNTPNCYDLYKII